MNLKKIIDKFAIGLIIMCMLDGITTYIGVGLLGAKETNPILSGVVNSFPASVMLIQCVSILWVLMTNWVYRRIQNNPENVRIFNQIYANTVLAFFSKVPVIINNVNQLMEAIR